MKLNKPEMISGRTGDGENYSFLNVRRELDTKAFNEDVREGAGLFKVCENCIREKPAKYILVDVENEEEGLMAVSYIYGMLREKEMVEKRLIDELPWNTSDCADDDVYDYEDDEDDYIEVGSLEDYLDSDETIPVLNLKDIYRALHPEEMSYMPFTGYMVSAPNMQINEPYWLSIDSKPVCILRNKKNGAGFFTEVDIQSIQTFESSRYVFIVNVSGQGLYNSIDVFEQNEWSDAAENDSESEVGSDVGRVILALTAEYIQIKASKVNRQNYYEKLFDSWLESFCLKLIKQSDKPGVVEKIVSIDQSHPSEIMEKTLKLFRFRYPELDAVSTNELRRMGVIRIASHVMDTKDMDQLVGLGNVKKHIKEIVHMMEYSRARQRAGLKGSEYHNVFMFLGAPGTAKTTVAKALGKMLKERKLLVRDRFISVSGSQLKAGYVGQTSGRVKALFENYDIILIDEAYSLAASNNGEMDVFAQEALAQLAIELEDHSTDKVVIFAGYGGDGVSGKDNKMEEFLTANPGIKSRINATITFPSYTPDEMVIISHKIAEEKDLAMSKAADDAIRKYYERRVSDHAFGNGREARALVERAELKMAQRINIDKISACTHLSISKQDILLAIQEIGTTANNSMRFGIV